LTVAAFLDRLTRDFYPVPRLWDVAQFFLEKILSARCVSGGQGGN
jgi:hypothetical protein